MGFFDLMNAIGAWIDVNLSAPLFTIFHPTNVALSAISAPIIWKICAVGLFGLAMVWVYMLKEEYVNMNAPGKHFWWDLRLWTIFCMLPHVIIYIWLGT